MYKLLTPEEHPGCILLERHSKSSLKPRERVYYFKNQPLTRIEATVLLSPDCLVRDKACVRSMAVLADHSRVVGNAVVSDFAVMQDRAWVCDDACLEDWARMSGESVVSGGAIVDGHAVLVGNASAEYGAVVSDGVLRGRAPFCSVYCWSARMRCPGKLQIGCQEGTREQWRVPSEESEIDWDECPPGCEGIVHSIAEAIFAMADYPNIWGGSSLIPPLPEGLAEARRRQVELGLIPDAAGYADLPGWVKT